MGGGGGRRSGGGGGHRSRHGSGGHGSDYGSDKPRVRRRRSMPRPTGRALDYDEQSDRGTATSSHATSARGRAHARSYESGGYTRGRDYF